MRTAWKGTSFSKKIALTFGAEKLLVQLPDISMQVRKESNNKYLNNFTEVKTYRRRRRQWPHRSNRWWYPSQLRLTTLLRTAPWKQHLHLIGSTPGFTGTSHVDRRENDYTAKKPPQPYLNTWQLSSSGQLQSDDTTSGSEHETSSTRASATHEQPSRGVWTHPQPVVSRADGNRCETLVL